MSEYKADLWAWFLRHAEVHNSFYWEPMEDKVKNHLTECGINLDNSETPDLGTVSEFVSTFDDNDEIACITVGTWVCKCGKYGTAWNVQPYRNRLNLAVRDTTLGDVITGVLNGT